MKIDLKFEHKLEMAVGYADYKGSIDDPVFILGIWETLACRL